MRLIRRRRLAGVVILALLAAGCAGQQNEQVAHTGLPEGAGSGKCPATSGLTGNVTDKGAAVAAGARLAIEAGDSFFKPTCETGVSAGAVTLVVTNRGQALHNVSVPAQGIDVDVQAGKTITVTVQVAGAPVPFFCTYHRTSGMVGSLVPPSG